MNKQPSSTDPDRLDGLGDPLRQAVEAVRREPVPVGSLRRAADRARAVGKPRASLRLPRLLLVAGAVAASFLFGLTLRYPTRPAPVADPGPSPRESIAERGRFPGAA